MAKALTHGSAHRTRPAESLLSRIGEALRANSLSIAFFGLFAFCVIGQIGAGLRVYNEEAAEHGQAAVGLLSYLTTGHFVEAMFENWESEFLQMALFVVLTAVLYQKGSAESRELEGGGESDENPSKHAKDPNAPWPVRRGGVWLALYERSLSIALFALFAVCFVVHALGGLKNVNAERLQHGQGPETLVGYVSSSQFWFESFQNWQSEFLAVLAMVLLSIWLRQRGSTQSKPVAAPHAKTGAE